MTLVRFIAKLGGAAISDKSAFETSNDTALQTSVDQLTEAYSQRRIADFIVIHGAGSFGHFQASRAGVDKGGIESAPVRDGFVETRRSVTKLNALVVSALIEAGVPAVGVSPCGFWTTANRQVSVGPVEGIEKLLKAGLIPVLHGDCVIDTAIGCTILSGDVIVKHLCSHFKPQFIAFLTNVDGLYDRCPDQPNAELIRHITVKNNGEWSAEGIASVSFSTSAHDTTGGIHGKVMECADIARRGYDVLICKAGSKSSRELLLQGSAAWASPQWRGTRITAVQASNQTATETRV